MRILAIDPSLTKTGLAFPDKTTSTLSAPKTVTGAARLNYLRAHLADIIKFGDFEGVILEDYSYASAQGAHQIGEWGGVLRLLLHDLEMPVALASPSSLKAYATGKGNSKKEVVISELTHRAGQTFSNSDEADAWGLAAMAYDWIGQPWIKVPEKNRAFMAKVQWPPEMAQP